jgi:hypothetical protein
MATGLSVLPADFFAAALVFPFFAGFVAGAAELFFAGFTGFSAAGLADLPVVAVIVTMEHLSFLKCGAPSIPDRS